MVVRMSEFDTDHEQVAEKRKETEAQRKKRLAASVSQVLATAHGRHVISEILGFCSVEGINALEGAAAFRAEGARAVGIRTINLLRGNDPTGFLQLYREINLS